MEAHIFRLLADLIEEEEYTHIFRPDTNEWVKYMRLTH